MSSNRMQPKHTHIQRHRIGVAVSLATLLFALGAVTLTAQEADPDVPLYDDLGTHHWEISTENPLAQRYFDQGLQLYYGFNHAEAIRAFEEAARLDPSCAMCLWGKALSLGPNINAPMDATAGAEAYTAIQAALDRAVITRPVELTLLDALALRYSPDVDAPRAAQDSAWAEALRDAHERFPDDPEVSVLLAEALMTLSPWNYWTKAGAPRPDTPEVLELLEHVLATTPTHPGANHFFIHAIEPVDPDRAVPMAERLAGLMPGAGHIVHMPGHIYIRVGRYMDAIRANEHAVHADETFIRDQRPGVGVYTAGYYPHNYDFMSFAAAMAGREEQSIGAADKVRELIPAELIGAPGMAFLEQHLTRALQMRVRFDRWDEIAETPIPAERLLHARGIWSYAQGRAAVATGRLEDAEGHLTRLRGILADPRLDGLSMEFNPSRTTLGVAAGVLEGVIDMARGRVESGLNRLRAAAELEDGMLYGEPPEWSVPVRHDLGAVLLSVGRADEAERVYREDLARFPENGWALRGLASSLTAQGRHAEARSVEDRLRIAWSEADSAEHDVGH